MKNYKSIVIDTLEVVDIPNNVVDYFWKLYNEKQEEVLNQYIDRGLITEKTFNSDDLDENVKFEWIKNEALDKVKTLCCQMLNKILTEV